MKKQVSRRAIEERLRRKLRHNEERLEKNRRGPNMEMCGDYLVIDVLTNSIARTFSDIEAYARESGVLKNWEVMAEV